MQANQLGSPIFIVGYFHSGTSLMRTILRREPSVWVIGDETLFFQDLTKVRKRFPNLGDETIRRRYIRYLVCLALAGPRYTPSEDEGKTLTEVGLSKAQFEQIVTATADCHEHERLFAAVMDCLTSIAGKERWLEKTPGHVYFLPEILRVLPDAKIIEMVRDPRATLSSRKLRQTDNTWLEFRESAKSNDQVRESNYDPVLDALMWKDSIHAARDHRHNRSGDILTVRYEDLVHDAPATVSRVCEFVGLPYSDDLLNVGWVNSTTRVKQQGAAGAEQAAGVSTAAVDKWRNELEPAELFLIQSLLKSEMRELRYKTEPIALGARLRAPMLLGGTVTHLLQRMNNRRRSPERARDSFVRIQRRLLKSLGFAR